MPSTATSTGFFLAAGRLCAMSGWLSWPSWTGECPPALAPSPWPPGLLNPVNIWRPSWQQEA